MAGRKKSSAERRERRLRGRAVADGRRAARQHGRRGVQARRPRPDLPQVHLRRLRGAARQAPRREEAGRRPRRPGRVPREGHLLGAARGALVAPQGAGEAAHHRPARGRRHGRRSSATIPRSRACCRRSTPARRSTRRASASSSTWSPTSASATPRAAPRTCSAACTSTSSRSSRAPRARRAASSTPRAAWSSCSSRCSSPTRAACTTPAAAHRGMFVQSEEFIGAHGGKLGDISIYGQESNYTTWRLAKMNLAIRGIEGSDRARRHLPQRPPPRSQGRLHPRQSALQRERLGRRAPARGQALEVRRAARRQRQLRLGAAHHPPPCARLASRASCSPTARCPPTSQARARFAEASSRRTSWTAWWRCPASSSTRRRFRRAFGSSRATRRTAASATAAAKCSSSTPASSADWWTAPTAN